MPEFAYSVQNSVKFVVQFKKFRKNSMKIRQNSSQKTQFPAFPKYFAIRNMAKKEAELSERRPQPLKNPPLFAFQTSVFFTKIKNRRERRYYEPNLPNLTGLYEVVGEPGLCKKAFVHTVLTFNATLACLSS